MWTRGLSRRGPLLGTGWLQMTQSFKQHRKDAIHILLAAIVRSVLEGHHWWQWQLPKGSELFQVQNST